ncbi:MAG TPA: sensor histidine kinase [Candidatus Dormibacteraeota bacterium]|nr:sensor histidine kinase [Candidatus Dormibacteraeota bacterium]
MTIAVRRGTTPTLRRSFVVPALLWVVLMALLVFQLFLTFGFDWRSAPATFRPNASSVAGFVAILAMSSVGALLAWRRPSNRIGWLLLAIALNAIFIDVPRLYVGVAVYVHPGLLPAALWVAWLGQVVWIFLFTQLLVVLPLVFPTGTLLSRRWFFVLWLAAIPVLLVVIASLDPTATAPLPNPMGVKAVAGFLNSSLQVPFGVTFFATSVLATASLILRFRRGDERERQQIKWLLAAVLLVLGSFIAQSLFPQLQNAPLLPLAAATLPVAIGIAVLRYRLYDIDVIINKALVFGGLAAVITAVYVLLVVGIGALIGSNQRFLLSLVATAVIALAFQPLRHRAQRLANRFVYGTRATPYEVLSQFSEHLSATYSHEDILERMARILAQGTGAERAEVWVRAGQRLLLASSSPQPAEPLMPLVMQNGALPDMQRDTVVPVSHAGELLGALAVSKKRGGTMNNVEQKLVTDLAGQAGLVLKNVGLNQELLARLDDLRASRQRLVTAQDEERRRLERDLHDGAQQHLVALKIKLGLAEAAAQPETKVRALITQLKQDADAAIDTMRDLARGIYPPLLASDGLEAALRGQIRRSTVPVDLEVDDVSRQPREAEAAVYFCCLEALQNVAKYAQAHRVRLRLWTEEADLAFRVEDDGKGFDAMTVPQGSGLQNMRDRMEALAGSLEVRSTPGGGTTIEGRIPVGLASP